MVDAALEDAQLLATWDESCIPNPATPADYSSAPEEAVSSGAATASAFTTSATTAESDTRKGRKRPGSSIMEQLMTLYRAEIKEAAKETKQARKLWKKLVKLQGHANHTQDRMADMTEAYLSPSGAMSTFVDTKFKPLYLENKFRISHANSAPSISTCCCRNPWRHLLHLVKNNILKRS